LLHLYHAGERKNLNVTHRRGWRSFLEQHNLGFSLKPKSRFWFNSEISFYTILLVTNKTAGQGMVAINEIKINHIYSPNTPKRDSQRTDECSPTNA